jgi:hypothetical protein
MRRMDHTGPSTPAMRQNSSRMTFHGVMLSYFHAHRLLNEPAAETRTRRAFETLINAARR